MKSEILVKLEYMNPSGSLKDRIAVTMIEQAEKEGKIKPGYTIIESSTGNTGFGLSSVGKLKGYKVCIYETMPGKAGAEKQKMMHNVGAEVRLMEPKDLQGLKERSVAGSEVELPGRMLCLEDERANPDKIWWARQFANRANVDAHHVTAKEILEQTDGKVDVFIQSIGTGGSLMGVAEVLKKECKNVKVIGIQPASSKELWHPGHGFSGHGNQGRHCLRDAQGEGVDRRAGQDHRRRSPGDDPSVVGGRRFVLRRIFRCQRSFRVGRSQESRRLQEVHRHAS